MWEDDDNMDALAEADFVGCGRKCKRRWGKRARFVKKAGIFYLKHGTVAGNAYKVGKWAHRRLR